jgi:hypothetical protein
MKFTIPKRTTSFCIVVALALLCSTLHAQVPGLINYQGRVVVGTTNFNGTGQFKFALMNSTNGQTLWSNDGTSSNGSEPTNAVSIAVSNGLYSVSLGSNSLPNMTKVPGTVFNNNKVSLRVWFNDGTHGSQLLSPDQRIASVGYAFLSATVGDPVHGSIAYADNGSDFFNIQSAPGGAIVLQTGGSGTSIELDTASLDPFGNRSLAISGGISCDSVIASGVTIGGGIITAGGGDFSGSVSTGFLTGTSGANFSGNVNVSGTVFAQSFSTSSDRNTKEHFRSVNARDVLSHIADLPIQTWTFKQDDAGTQHIGPMAQDFYAAFQVGPDDKHITTVDAEGVAFAAIQGLNEIVHEQNAELAARAKKIDALEKRVDEIEKTLKQTPSNQAK